LPNFFQKKSEIKFTYLVGYKFRRNNFRTTFLHESKHWSFAASHRPVFIEIFSIMCSQRLLSKFSICLVEAKRKAHLHIPNFWSIIFELTKLHKYLLKWLSVYIYYTLESIMKCYFIKTYFIVNKIIKLWNVDKSIVL